MSVYRDAGHCIARVFSIETNDGTTKSGWQMKYQPPGWPEEPPAQGSGLNPSDRLTQDSMTRRMLHRELTAAQWNALAACRSINDAEVAESVKWLAANAVTPAHYLFRMKAVTAWVRPQKAPGQKSTRSLPDGFYLVHTWDNEGKPEGTLRRWKSLTNKWLNAQVASGYDAVERLLAENGLKIDEAA